MEDGLAKLVQCAVCLDSMVKPQLLACLHSFCKACLDSIAGKRQKVVCPYCKTATQQKRIAKCFKALNGGDDRTVQCDIAIEKHIFCILHIKGRKTRRAAP